MCILPWCICSELDVETMLKDFSDKLNENLVPDPWDDDTDEQDDGNWFFSLFLWGRGSLFFYIFFNLFFFQTLQKWVRVNSVILKMMIMRNEFIRNKDDCRHLFSLFKPSLFYDNCDSRLFHLDITCLFLFFNICSL